MPSKKDTQFQREREMRDRLGEWLTVAAKIDTDSIDAMWFAGGIYPLRGLVLYRTAHLNEAVLRDIAAEVDLNLRTRLDAADIARSASA